MAIDYRFPSSCKCFVCGKQLKCDAGQSYLIFVTGTTGGARGENLVMWRNLSTWQMVRWSNSPHDRLSCGKNSPHEKYEENLWKMWRNKVYNVWCSVAFYIILWFTLFCREICSSRFTRFCVETNFTKNCARGEKMTNMRYVINMCWLFQACMVILYNRDL